MSKRILYVPTVLCVLLLSEMAGECFADASTQLEQAEKYRKKGQYEQAGALYEQILTGFPGTDYAFQAHRNLPGIYIAMDRQADSQAAFEEMLTDYAEHERLPHAVHEVVEKCSKLGKADKARQLCSDVLSDGPESSQAIWLQMGVAISNTHLGDNGAVDAAIQEIIANFSEDQRSAEAISQVAWSYRKLKEYKKAKHLHQYVVNNWPYKDRAIFSQRGIVLCNIALGDKKAAWSAVEKLFTDFSQDEHLAKAVSSIAESYRSLKKYKEARELHQYVLDKCPESEDAIWSQRGVVLSNIGLGDDPNTETAIKTLFKNFSKHQHIAKVVYQIARKLKDDEKAGELYQYIVDNHRDSDFMLFARANIGNINIRLGDDEAARSIFDKLLVDFRDHSILPKAVALMADGYYNEALLKKNQGQDEEAREYLLKAITEYERIIKQLPETVHTTAEAHRVAADCYYRLGHVEKALEYNQKVVDNWPDYMYAWDALFWMGRHYEEMNKSGLLSKSEAFPKIKAVYQHILEKYPTCPAAKHARRWLSRHATK